MGVGGCLGVCVDASTQPLSRLCDPMDGNPPGSSVHQTLQVRILEWGATSYCRGSSPPRD